MRILNSKLKSLNQMQRKINATFYCSYQNMAYIHVICNLVFGKSDYLIPTARIKTILNSTNFLKRYLIHSMLCYSTLFSCPDLFIIAKQNANLIISLLLQSKQMLTSKKWILLSKHVLPELHNHSFK